MMKRKAKLDDRKRKIKFQNALFNYLAIESQVHDFQERNEHIFKL